MRSDGTRPFLLSFYFLSSSSLRISSEAIDLLNKYSWCTKEALCRRLGFRERRFSAFFEEAHFLAGERDGETQDFFWSEGMAFRAEGGTAHSEAWSLDRARTFRNR